MEEKKVGGQPITMKFTLELIINSKFICYALFLFNNNQSFTPFRNLNKLEIAFHVLAYPLLNMVMNSQTT